jgi:hypothetical protein
MIPMRANIVAPDVATRIKGLHRGLPFREAGLQIGEPDVIRPSVCADRDRIAATIIRAIN